MRIRIQYGLIFKQLLVVMCAVSYLSKEVFSNGIIPDLPVLSFRIPIRNFGFYSYSC